MLKVNLQSLVRPKIFWSSIIVLVVLCVTFYILKEKEKSLRVATEEELSITIEVKIAAEKELSRTVEEKKIVESNLKVAKQEITKRDDLIELTLDKLEKEVVARKEIEAQLVTAVKEKQDLVAQIEELAVKLPKTVELEKIVIKKSPGLEGRILSYDREHTFVVVDLGNQNNLRLGEILSVYRDDKFIGKVQVEKLEDETSAAVILTPWRNVEYKESDVVKKI